jgi:cobalt/nickel transport system permease protein
VTKDRLLLLAWAAGVLAASFVHDLGRLALLLLAAAAIAGRETPRAAKRAALAVAVFGGTVGVAWLVFALVRGEPDPLVALRGVARLELRAFLLTFLTFGFLVRVDADRLLARHPGLRAARVVTLAQIRLFGRLLEDFRFALEARSIRPLGWRVRLRHAAAASGVLLARALRESEEIGLAMEARGLLAGEPAAGPPPEGTAR